MPRSLLDGADVAALRAGGARGWELVLACLIQGGVVQQDPDDPEWADRDRLVVAGEAPRAATEAAFRRSQQHPDRGWTDGRTAGEALGIAYGLAASSDLDGGIFRVYAVLDGAAGEDGRVWEILRSAALARTRSLVVVAVAGQTAAAVLADVLWVAGWTAARAGADDPVEVLGALDQALADERRPTGVLAVMA